MSGIGEIHYSWAGTYRMDDALVARFMKTLGQITQSRHSKTQKPRNARLFVWWAHTDSNRGRKDYELLGEVLCLEKSFEGERRLA
ncbi:hypothetical protein CF597_16700 [Pseudomonas sp. PSB1]|nr:hypothetical protein [Pseudomonas sp. PSB1]